MDQAQIGKFIASLRKEKKRTQEQLAETLGVNHRSVSRWENGHCMPDLSMLSVLSKELEVDVSELLHGRRRSSEELRELRESIDHILARSQEEKKMKTRKLNLYLILGAACLVLTLLQDQFALLSSIFQPHVDQFIDGLLTGLAVVFLLVGLYNNNREHSLAQRKRAWLSKLFS